MRPHPLLIPSAAVASAMLLTGCVTNDGRAGAIRVEAADRTCVVALSTVNSGTVTFSVTNTGSDLNEFEVLADDGLRIVGEKENITPGTTVDYALQLQPGSYYTACKFQQTVTPHGVTPFTVVGEAVPAPNNQAARDLAVSSYRAYISSQTENLVPAVGALADAYVGGDDEKARLLFAAARVPYERIEPTASSFGDLDPRLDYREIDAAAEGLNWTGFHRIEKDLWPPASGAVNSDGVDAFRQWAPSTPEQRTVVGAQLIADAQQLDTLVRSTSFSLTLADISNGAIGLLDEVASRKLTGEEDWWSHTDLADVAANVQGAQVAYGTVRDLASASGPTGAQLVADIDTRFASLQSVLDQYGDLNSGFRSYNVLSDAERRQISDRVNALAEPLAGLTHTVLGVGS